jgi:hypothetical protein
MKKITLIFVLACAAIVFTSSCKKECDKQNNNQVINVSIPENSNYTYNLPSADHGGSYQISQQASYYLTSALATTPGTSSMTYSYTPAKDYVGKDAVVFSSGMGSQGNPPNNCGNQNGNCNHQCNQHDGNRDDNQTITINITVVSANTNTITGVSK